MQSNPNSGADSQQGEQVAWWFKFLARGMGTIGGLVAMILGIVRCITFTPLCLVAGVMQMLVGFVAVMFEAPCCCQFIEFADKIGQFSERRPYWQKGAIYCGISLLPIIMCFSASVIFGSGLVFVTGALYGLMAVGKKADKNKMIAAARDDVEMKAQLIDNEEKVDLHVPDTQGK